MTLQANNALQAFQWSPQPQAWSFLRALAEDFLASCPDAGALAQRMADETGTRFVDWIDHVRLPRRDARARQLSDVGYQAESDGAGYTVFVNDNGMFPPVLVWDGTFEIAIKVESIADFLTANGLQREVIGAPLSQLRTCQIFRGRDCAMSVYERHGTRAFEAAEVTSKNPIE